MKSFEVMVEGWRILIVRSSSGSTWFWIPWIEAYEEPKEQRKIPKEVADRLTAGTEALDQLWRSSRSYADLTPEEFFLKLIDAEPTT